MADNRKYIFDANGLPTINPQYQAMNPQPVSSMQNPNALAVVSTIQDQVAMAQLTNFA